MLTSTPVLPLPAGMPSPHGYRTALRLMQLAEKFHLPVVSRSLLKSFVVQPR
jgi:hypothetical protein